MVIVWVKEIVVTGGGAAGGPEDTGTTSVPVRAVATVLVAGIGTKVMVLGTAVQMPGF